MCGRYLLDLPGSSLAEAFGARDHTAGFQPRYNVAPTQLLPVVTLDTRERVRSLMTMQWGLAPRWAAASGRPQRPLVNARAETLADKPSFRDAFARRRCLVPASGFYEWAQGPSGKVPHLVSVPGRSVFAMAGIYECWANEHGEPVETFAVVTTAPNDAVRPLHDRMPAILDDAQARDWLETPPDDQAALHELLRPWAGPMEIWPVSRDLNDVSCDHAGLAQRNEPAPTLPGLDAFGV